MFKYRVWFWNGEDFMGERFIKATTKKEAEETALTIKPACADRVTIRKVGGFKFF